jgi:hypothetical protein
VQARVAVKVRACVVRVRARVCVQVEGSLAARTHGVACHARTHHPTAALVSAHLDVLLQPPVSRRCRCCVPHLPPHAVGHQPGHGVRCRCRCCRRCCCCLLLVCCALPASSPCEVEVVCARPGCTRVGVRRRCQGCTAVWCAGMQV